MNDSPIIDLFGVQVELWIENNAKWIPFRNIAGNATDYIQSVSIRVGLMNNFTMNVKICPPLADAIALLNSGKVGLGFSASNSTSSVKSSSKAGEDVDKSNKDYHMNKIAIRIKYGGQISPWFRAILLMPEFELSNEEGIEISLNGVGMLFEATKKPAIIDGEISAVDAIKKLLGSGNQNINVVFTDSALKNLNESKNISVSSGVNSMEEASKILKANHCYFICEGAPDLTSKQVFKVFSSQDRRNTTFGTFVAFRQIDPNNGIYPILSLRSPLTNVVVGSMLLNAKNEFYDKSKKQSVIKPQDGKSYQETGGNKIPANDNSAPSVQEDSVFDSDSIEGTILGSTQKRGSGFIDVVKGAAIDFMEKTFEYQISTVCIPAILPGRLVGIGVADIKALSGQYDLVSVEHTISSGGAETSLECRAMGGLAAAAGVGMNKIVSAAADKLGSGDKNKNVKTSTKVSN